MKIIKDGKKTFRLTCNKCGCEFEYELDEIGTTIPGKVECPCCGEYLYHPNQDIKIDNIIYHPGTIISNSVLDNDVTTYTDPFTTKAELKGAIKCKNCPNFERGTIDEEHCGWCDNYRMEK